MTSSYLRFLIGRALNVSIVCFDSRQYNKLPEFDMVFDGSNISRRRRHPPSAPSSSLFSSVRFLLPSLLPPTVTSLCFPNGPFAGVGDTGWSLEATGAAAYGTDWLAFGVRLISGGGRRRLLTILGLLSVIGCDFVVLFR